jgi:nucleoside-diphosphate-sugar epimerase
MSRHVVLGSGQIGTHVAAQLIDAGHEVIVVSRSGRNTLPGARAVAGDITDPSFAATAASGANVIYFCLNATNYNQWPQQFPPLQRAAMQAAAAAGARLVVLDNLYGYGPANGKPLTETTGTSATSAKALTRVAMTNELLNAHRSGQLQVTIGRASDFFGPNVTQSALGEHLIGAALNGKRSQIMGNPDVAHSYSYAPDVARSLIQLGHPDAPTGEIWHLPIAETITTRQLINHLNHAAGHPARLTAAGRTALTVVGLFKPELRELRHTLYQFVDNWIVDDSKYRAAFGDPTTPLPVAAKETIDWYRTQPTKEKK